MFFRNKQQANEHQNINGKFNNISPPERHRPPKSCNAVYNQSKAGLFKNNNKKCHDRTSLGEGQDLGKMSKLWEKLAASESKLEMMGKMMKRNVGSMRLKIL